MNAFEDAWCEVIQSATITFDDEAEQERNGSQLAAQVNQITRDLRTRAANKKKGS